ncbi:MAG: monofunctional biosynthetic peptidoglycan transglycosylase [Flavobacteriales bacterium]|jgi:monofunctional biosynthetic peptidoglycan transglycosylase|nr:monofunctional biosynthetic peptidoglycan transglycosylase [Flavobacteriales bacterium]MBP7448481.1 monofunctional biosynthetic peptidoglycan transglycosylase [Flavobacteriales bacterium]HOZ39901.1 monofunctional biosynthetic peptidoglycan transglycosylase [Flavobacteriales bacterium]
MWPKLLRILRWSGAALAWALIVCVLWVGLLGLVDPPVTWVMVEQANEQDTFIREVIDLSEVARVMPLSVMASEDQRFMFHSGFSWEAMRKAMDRNKKGKRIRGGSTISQQTAKNVFLWPGRTYVRKGLEAGFTLLIELLWTKERILEVYLNVAEMGKGVFGVEAAAQHCFGRPASRLTAAQAALITSTLPAPRRFNCERPSGYLAGRQQWVLRQMRNIGDVLDPEVRAGRERKIEEEERRKEEREARNAARKAKR